MKLNKDNFNKTIEGDLTIYKYNCNDTNFFLELVGNNENRNIYSKMKSSLEHLNREVVATMTDLQRIIRNLLGMIHALDQKLMMAKNKNTTLENIWAHTEGSDNGSRLMIKDSKELHKMQRISNIDIILGNVLLIIVLFRVFRTSSSSMSIKQ